ncbi:MAG TPA: HAMP domain-containing sensor histidine kinase [Solirubrobacteraceae bacterium]|nr:HAMP domain-containing sensor histidine kinase [Solirubrobacteraceae bacterium]
MTRWPLRTRVTAAAAGALGLAVALLCFGGYLFLRSGFDREASAVLRERAGVQLAALDQRGGRLVVREVPGDEAIDRSAWVFDATGRTLERPAGATAAADRAARALATAPAARERDLDGTLRLRAQPAYATGGQTRIGTVVVSLDLRPYERTERNALLTILAVGLVVVLAGTAIARRAAGAALRPVGEMTRRAAEWRTTDLDARFNGGGGGARDELGRLAATFDELLRRIAAVVRHEQRMTAELAHELRTPLTALLGESELALRAGRTPQELRAAHERIHARAERMTEAVEILLAAERAGTPDPTARADARAAVQLAVEAARASCSRSDVHVAGPGGGAPVPVSAEAALVTRALGPLIDNAVRHARSRVDVRVEDRGTSAVVCVIDDGAGLAQPELERAFEPGHRATDSPGAGLGLPLARRLARSAGGDVAAEPGPGGRFLLRLPR